MRRLVMALILLFAAASLAGQDRPSLPPVIVLTAKGPVSPAMSDYIRRNLGAAAARGSPLVVLKLDTPGGLDTSMREIIQAILASPVPVAAWVAPQGGRAASAGTYILYASHIAAMAPATNLGAATPVSLTGPGGAEDGPRAPLPVAPPRDDDSQATPADPPAAPPRPSGTAMEAKVINDAVAYIRGLAELRGRNADWAEAAVRRGESLSSGAAAAEGVIDFVAADLVALLNQADGRVVMMEGGPLTLATAGLAHEVITPDWRTAILSVITNPNVALILMLVGVYGIILEFLNPGVLVAGTVGGISLILGLYALALLPVSYAGIGLILLGLALIVAEAFAPSFGVLGIGGTAALVLGAVILIDTDAPGFVVSVPIIAGVAVAGLISTLIIARLAARSFAARVVSGAEAMIGAPATVLDWQKGQGHVWAKGERWQAIGPEVLPPQEPICITAISGLVLQVEPPGHAT
ncbi:nodulation protein NfeD [Rhodobacteraceae bacterium 2376]|uniref:Nodulation protein NfeD n=2 Tax=Rhabdonatronobacter sediminivivens TaxID=2743469 RepID=A0A7Z0I2B4_9RHOB|nr:nodulation protein NfeD [Rhabdonatronobacter sediminivivens]